MKKNLLRNALAVILLCTFSNSLLAQIPELMWFKFNTSTGGVTPNDAPAATKVCPSGTIVGTQLSVSGTGQFGTGLAAAAMTSTATDYVNTGWATNLTGQSWTISLWLNIPNPATTRYYFGDNTAGSFRCFTGGAASTGLRLTGPFTINTSTIQPGPCVVHYVYDNTALTVSAYVNGVFNTSITVASPPALAGAGPFKIGGYASGNGYEGIIDEFRMYNRALTATEITNTWNQPLGSVCNAPTGLTATGVTYNSANTSWGAVTGATGYEYAVTTSATAPATGTATTGTSYNAPALTAGTTYYLHVRTQCATGFSTWSTYSFTTLACTAPTGLTSSSVTSNSASFNWVTSGGSGYEYAITNSTTPPASGTATTNTSYNAIGLNPNTNYCLHVRTTCGTGIYSPWVNTCITTLAPPPCPGVDTLNVANITAATADLSWNSVAGTTGYEYAVTQSAVPPASGTAITATNYSASGLTFATQYYAHVRAVCSGGLFSAWKTKPFNTPTPPCDAPTATVSNITNEDADISWAAMPYAQSYQVAVFSNPNPPNISGIQTTATNYHVVNLISGKLYYVHLRTICAFDTSAWSTATFYSTIPASVSIVNGAMPSIKAYPNPVKGMLTVDLGAMAGKNAQLTVTDITGKIVNRKTELAGNKTEINMDGLAPGIYLLKYADDERSQTVRVTKE